MPRKANDPVVAILNYFETASVEAAAVTLTVVKEIIRRREGGTAPVPRHRGPGKSKAKTEEAQA